MLALKAHPPTPFPVISRSYFCDLMISSLEGPFLLPNPSPTALRITICGFNPLFCFLANSYSSMIQPRSPQSEDFPFLLPSWHFNSLGRSQRYDEGRHGIGGKHQRMRHQALEQPAPGHRRCPSPSAAQVAGGPGSPGEGAELCSGIAGEERTRSRDTPVVTRAPLT